MTADSTTKVAGAGTCRKFPAETPVSRSPSFRPVSFEDYVDELKDKGERDLVNEH